MTAVCVALASLFAFLMLSPHAEVHYDSPPAVRNSR